MLSVFVFLLVWRMRGKGGQRSVDLRYLFSLEFLWSLWYLLIDCVDSGDLMISGVKQGIVFSGMHWLNFDGN